ESIASSAVTAFPDRARDRNVASRRMRAYCCPVALCFPFVTSNASSHASIAETVAPVALRTRFVAVALQLEEKARGDRGVGEVREHAVDAKTIELQVLVDRVAGVVGQQPLLLVAERPGVDEESDLVGTRDQVGRRQRAAARLAWRGRARDWDRGHDVALPRADTVGIGLDLAQAGVGDEEPEGARKQARIARGGP